MICVKPVHDEVDEINCKYKSLFDAVAVITTFKGPPDTVNVYHPSLLKVPKLQPVAMGVSCVVSVREAPVSHAPLTTKVSADPQVVPCANV